MGRIFQVIKNFLFILVNLIKSVFGYTYLKISLATRNPIRFFTHLAYWLLAIYVVIGVLGAYMIYNQKSTNIVAKSLSVIYPYPCAFVKNSPIWMSQYYRQLDFLTKYNIAASDKKSADFPTVSELPQKVIDNLVEEKIDYIEAKKLNVEVTDTELNKAVADQGDEKEYAAKIKQLYGMTIAEYKNVIALEILKEKLKTTVLTRVRLSQILTIDQASIGSAKNELNKGANFADVVTKYSQDSLTSKDSGDMGFWRKGELAASISQEFEDKVFALKVGDVSDVIQTKYGYHIIKVTDRVEGKDMSYDEWYASVKPNYRIFQFFKPN